MGTKRVVFFALTSHICPWVEHVILINWLTASSSIWKKDLYLVGIDQFLIDSGKFLSRINPITGRIVTGDVKVGIEFLLNKMSKLCSLRVAEQQYADLHVNLQELRWLVDIEMDMTGGAAGATRTLLNDGNAAALRVLATDTLWSGYDAAVIISRGGWMQEW